MAVALVALDLRLGSQFDNLHGDLPIMSRQICRGCGGSVREVCIVTVRVGCLSLSVWFFLFV
jgi:hypothetical protein